MKPLRDWSPMRSAVTGAAIGIILSVIFLAAASQSHTPCNDLELIEKPCKYVLVVNPYTGQMETQYVCK